MSKTLQKEQDNFIKIVKDYTSYLKKYRNAYNNYLERRQKNTDLARTHRLEMVKYQGKIDDILTDLREYKDNFNKDIKYNNSFLGRQHKLVESKESNIDSNTDIINDKKSSVNSKEIVLNNNNTLLNDTKKQIKKYVILNIVSVIIIVAIYFYLRKRLSK